MTVSSATSSTSSTTSSSSSSSTTSSSSSLTTSGTSTTSTIDWTALIQSAVDAKLTQATQISTKITSNEAKITAYQTLQTALKTLSSGLSSLATSMVNSLATNVFATRAATISATGDVSASSALSMSVNNGAATGSHTLTISQIATAHKVAGTTQSSQTTALGYSGTFSLGLSGGTTADITYSSSSGDDILNKLGVTDSSGAFATVLQTAQAAEFTLDGISLTRNTNDITDVLSGVTFDLLQATPSGTTLNISIGTDTSQISSALQTFVTNYNAFRDAVIAQQTTNSDGTAASSAVLFGDGTMRDIMNTLQDVLGTSVGGLTMADLGLSFNEKN
ncbi:MAG: flagellar filament capping protein FliD, partial [Bradyrhizobium sp.]|nr:flagellar filament capping protein FliD [Bradyrhizobium sp.]